MECQLAGERVGATIEEMKSVVMADGRIEAEGRRKDDRFIAASLAHEAWARWVRSRLRGLGLTFGGAANTNATPNQLQKMALDYLRKSKIAVN